MAKRRKMSRKQSKKVFTKGAVKQNGLNKKRNTVMPMRDGFRI